MIPLHAKLEGRYEGGPLIARLTSDPTIPPESRSTEALLLEEPRPVNAEGFRAVFVKGKQEAHTVAGSVPVLPLPESLSYLADGDVVRLDPRRRHLRVLYRKSSPHNGFLLTERCNSRCLMCSQPPRDVDDGYLVDELLEVLPLVSPDTASIGFTGGEPTLLYDRFLDLLASARDHLPQTHVDVLTNGRLLAYLRYAERIGAVGHSDLRLCIPLYSDIDAQHDFVVQARGAFDETVRGLLNLGRVGVPVEVRVVIHQQTYRRLPRLAEFITRNLPFVSHVALMGLEVTGFTRANLPALWIDPVEYADELTAAVDTLAGAGIPTSIYNHQLCVLPEALWPYAARSISDWKNTYLAICDECSVRSDCGGFFETSGGKHSACIHPL